MSLHTIIIPSALLTLALACGVPVSAAPQPAHEPAGEQAVAEGHAAEEEHEEGVMPTVARLANFAILAGVLVYFLRSPLAGYLQSRGEHIRAELVQAAEMRRTAEAQLAEVSRQMQALPGELESLRTRGAQDIAAEEARIRATSQAERDRLLEQMRREVEMQVRIAQNALRSEAAALATDVARRRIEAAITPADHVRLLDRYAGQLGGTP